MCHGDADSILDLDLHFVHLVLQHLSEADKTA